jgi:hypothetical protein
LLILNALRNVAAAADDEERMPDRPRSSSAVS